METIYYLYEYAKGGATTIASNYYADKKRLIEDFVQSRISDDGATCEVVGMDCVAVNYPARFVQQNDLGDGVDLPAHTKCYYLGAARLVR